MIVEKSFDGATGTEVLLEAHVVVAGAASDVDGTKPTSGDAYVAGFSLGGLFDCKRAEAQV